MGPQYLEQHLLDTPPVAMQQVRNEIVYMLSVAKRTHDFDFIIKNKNIAELSFSTFFPVYER